jgi:alanyl-tRNA synthetase
VFFGRKDNFWEMADIGPCGPCSEIHLDRGESYCEKKGTPGHECVVNGDCNRFLELWNLVFIQYNRTGVSALEPLPSKNVDTGMGLDRIVSVLQDTDSNYRTDLLFPLLQTVQELTGHTNIQREENLTPYRVIADHSRAAAFLIADGVIPGNIGRNYVCRMIIRRAARFGNKIGLYEPFLAKVAERVIDIYGNFYPELVRSSSIILESLTYEEERFQRTVESGVAILENLLDKMTSRGESRLPGEEAFDLYATYGLPLEITRDIAREKELEVDEAGFHLAMKEHRLASGAGEIFGSMGGEDVDLYRNLLVTLQEQRLIGLEGVKYNPYEWLKVKDRVLAIVHEGKVVQSATVGDRVEIILPKTGFYVESGGQVSDTGTITGAEPLNWEIQVTDMRKPAAGIIVHVGEVVTGNPKVNDMAIAAVDVQRRRDIMRNHTATHLLHAELRSLLGFHARQAGSLVAPDRLRFDFTHPQAVTPKELEQVEEGVNRAIMDNYLLRISYKPLQQAIEEGATALFGEKYTDTVRNITIGESRAFSNELCGGTHVAETGDVGLFLITSEGSAAAGIRRIEAVTGRGAYELVKQRFMALKQSAIVLMTTEDDTPNKAKELIEELENTRKQLGEMRRNRAIESFLHQLDKVDLVKNIPVLGVILEGADADTLRLLTDRFRQQFTSGVVVLASIEGNGKPVVVAAVTEDLIHRGLHAGNLVKFVAGFLDGGGGGRPNLAQAGGKDASKLNEAMEKITDWVTEHLN